uniref:Nucleoside diphosphatase n=1 Tax=Tetraselmis sp. GSL018 TaxID=582737 RepID=A0A061SHQ5_9CHLO
MRTGLCRVLTTLFGLLSVASCVRNLDESAATDILIDKQGYNGNQDPQKAYGILLDAGSGSTKPTVWHWDPCYDRVPKLKLVEKQARLPPLASFARTEGGKPEEAGRALEPALLRAKAIIPEELWKHTPIFLTATAGMRLIPEKDRADILRVVNVWLADPSNHPFLYGTSPPFSDGEFWSQTISGEDEGAYGFLDVNFLLGKLVGQDKSEYIVRCESNSTRDGIDCSDPALSLGSKSMGAIGWIDTGGASLQVSFAPQESSILGNVYPVSPIQFTHITNSTGSRYASTMLYTHSWNGLGQREARKRMQRGISRAADIGKKAERFAGGTMFSDPCLLRGQRQDMTFETEAGRPPRNVTFVGGSDFYMCQWFVDDFVLNLREECLLSPCGAAGVYVPEPGSITFMGFRKMLELARPLGLAKKHGSWAPSYEELMETVHRVCRMSGEEAHQAGIPDEWETDSGPCFKGVLIMRFLQTIGSPRIVFADRIHAHKFTYARGAMLSFIVEQDRRSHRSRPKGWPQCLSAVATSGSPAPEAE